MLFFQQPKLQKLQNFHVSKKESEKFQKNDEKVLSEKVQKKWCQKKNLKNLKKNDEKMLSEKVQKKMTTKCAEIKQINIHKIVDIYLISKQYPDFDVLISNKYQQFCEYLFDIKQILVLYPEFLLIFSWY